MPRKKLFDTRDSLDILREAFVGEAAPMRRPRARVVSTQELTPLQEKGVGHSPPQTDKGPATTEVQEQHAETQLSPEEAEGKRKMGVGLGTEKARNAREEWELFVKPRWYDNPASRNFMDPNDQGAYEALKKTRTELGETYYQQRESEILKRTAENKRKAETLKAEWEAKIAAEEKKAPRDLDALKAFWGFKEATTTTQEALKTVSPTPQVEVTAPRKLETQELNPKELKFNEPLPPIPEHPVSEATKQKTEEAPNEQKLELVAENAIEHIPTTLDEARAQYVRADMEMRRLLSEKGGDPAKRQEAINTAEKSRHQYAEMWRTEKEKLKEPERKVVTTQEALRLLDERIQARIELSDKNKLERGAHVMGRTALQVGNWYRKQSFKRKIAASVILGGAGLTGAVAGGVFGTAVAGSVLGARIVQRTLGGLGTASAVEAVAQRWQNKKLEKNVQERIAGELGTLLETIGGNEELNTKLSKIEKTEKNKKRLRYALAATAGVAVFNIAHIAHAARESDLVQRVSEKLGIMGKPAVPKPDIQAMEKALTETTRKTIRERANDAIIRDKFVQLDQRTLALEADISQHTLKNSPTVLEISPTEEHIPLKTNVNPLLSLRERLTMEHLAIGKRGPEGAIIDFFKANPDTAKTYGWDGKTKNFSKWVGKRAHQLWLDSANEALANNETLAEMKRLGYPATPKGYADMMRHIGKGAVDFDTARGKIGLIDMEYLKAEPLEIAKAPSPITIAEAPYNSNTFLNTFSDHSVAEQATIAENLKHTSEALEQEIATTADPTLHEMKKSLLMQTQETLAQSERWHALHEQWLVKSGLSEQQLAEVMEKWDVRKFLSVDKKIQLNGQLKGPLEWALGTHDRSVHELASSLKSKTIDPHLNLKEALKHIITK